MKQRAPLRIALALGIALAASACQTAAPVNKPCGIIVDSLATVRGATPADTRRIDVHFERGVSAGCWRRS